MGENLYSILGVSDKADSEQIRKAYIDLARRYHPDANEGRPNAEFFIQIQHAYEVLSNPDLRKKYDQEAQLQATLTEPFKTTWILSRVEIPRIKENQVIYGRLEIQFAGNDKDFKTPPSHLCIVLDKSTSMKGQRLDGVKQNLRQLITEIRNVDLVSVVTFNDKAEIVIAPTSSSDRNALIKKIDGIEPTGGTEIYRGLKAGFDLLWQGNSEGYSLNLLLLTDGHTYGDEERCIELAKTAAEKNVRISALGFGNDWNDNFLDKVTGITGGCAEYVRNLFDLPKLILGTIETMKTTIAHSMNLEIEKGTLGTIKFCFKLDPETMQLPIENTLQLGSLLKEKKSTFIFAFELPRLEPSITETSILNGKIRFLVGDRKEQSFIQDVALTLPVKDNPEKKKIPPEIVQALSRITLYQMQEKSSNDVKSGNVNDAVRRLNFMATQLIEQGNVNFAKEVLNEAENIKNEQNYSEDGIKRLKYGTRALLQLPAPEKRMI